MKFPKLVVALLLATGLAWSVGAPAPKTAAKPAAKPAKIAKPKPLTSQQRKAAKQDSLRRVDSLKLSAQKQRLDSLVADTLQRANVRRLMDSLHVLDSVRQVDSLHRRDSILVADSLARLARSWYQARTRDLAANPIASTQLFEKLRLQLLRTGSLVMPTTRDTSSSFEGAWKQAVASKSGRFLYSALSRTSDSGWKLTSWLYDLTTSRKLDSAGAYSSLPSLKALDELAKRTTRRLRPSPSEATCTADSLSQASLTWALVTPATLADSTANARWRSLLGPELVGTGRAKAILLAASPNCATPLCLDSLGTAAGAQRTLFSQLQRQPDSSWSLAMVWWNAGHPFDSALVTAPTLENLASKAVRLLAVAPANCRSLCTRAQPEVERLIWSLRSLQADSARAATAQALGAQIAASFARDGRHQFLTAPKTPPATGVEAIQRWIEGRLEGSDSLWTLKAKFRNSKDSLLDSLSLSRGGYRPRVFAWFARRLVEAAHPTVAGCGSSCSEESTAVSHQSWAFPPTQDLVGEATMAKLINDNLVQNAVSQKLGKVVAYPDSLPCTSLRCLDSLAASRGAQRVFWTTLTKTRDSAWVLDAKVTEASTDLVLDSTHLLVSGNPLQAVAYLPKQALANLVPAAARCDSCTSQDTLEAGLALIEPQWSNVIDTLRNLFLDSMGGVLAREGHYQILPWAATDTIYTPWKNQACDSVCQATLRCRTGASFMVTSAVSRDGSGWVVEAKLTDLRTGKLVSQISTREPRNDAQRLREIAPWAARKLVGTDSTAMAPHSRHFLSTSWGKVLALAIPVALGMISVFSRW